MPNADEIEIPEGVALEESEPVTPSATDDSGKFTLRLRRGVADAIARWLARARLLFDRLLLIIAIPAPLLILGYQSFEWLRSERWPALPVEQLFLWLRLDPTALASTPWAGLNDTLAWLFAVPLAPALFVLGLSLHVLTGLLFPRIVPE